MKGFALQTSRTKQTRTQDRCSGPLACEAGEGEGANAARVSVHTVAAIEPDSPACVPVISL